MEDISKHEELKRHDKKHITSAEVMELFQTLRQGQFGKSDADFLLKEILLGMITQFRLDSQMENKARSAVETFIQREWEQGFHSLFANVFISENFIPTSTSSLSIHSQFLRFVREKSQRLLLPFLNELVNFTLIDVTNRAPWLSRNVWKLFTATDANSARELREFMTDHRGSSRIQFHGVLSPYANQLNDNYPFIPTTNSYFPIKFLQEVKNSKGIREVLTDCNQGRDLSPGIEEWLEYIEGGQEYSIPAEVRNVLDRRSFKSNLQTMVPFAAYRSLCRDYHNQFQLLEPTCSDFLYEKLVADVQNFEDIFLPFTCFT
jgi:hypothetical protein